MTPENTQALEAIKARCDEVGDCWIWRDGTTAGGYPIFKPAGCKCTLVRRAAFVLAGGKLKPREPLAAECDDRLCVNPAHLKKSTCAKIAQKAADRGAFSGKARSAKIAAAKRKDCKLNPELASEIRMSSDTGPVLAARHNIHRSLVTRIKAGKAWRDYKNPFAGLMT